VGDVISTDTHLAFEPVGQPPEQVQSSSYRIAVSLKSSRSVVGPKPAHLPSVMVPRARRLIIDAGRCSSASGFNSPHCLLDSASAAACSAVGGRSHVWSFDKRRRRALFTEIPSGSHKIPAIHKKVTNWQVLFPFGAIRCRRCDQNSLRPQSFSLRPR